MIFEIILSFFIILSAFYGLFLGGKMKKPNHLKHIFEYYTNLSNLLIMLFQILRLYSVIFSEKNLVLYLFLQRSDISFAVTNAILMTFIIYHFILLPYFKDKKHVATLNNYCVHYITPVLSVVFWLFFCEKELSPSIIYMWLPLPFAYYVYIIGRAILGINLAGKDTPYPYFFIDRKKIGNKRFAIGIICSMLGFVALGALTYLVALLLK